MRQLSFFLSMAIFIVFACIACNKEKEYVNQSIDNGNGLVILADCSQISKTDINRGLTTWAEGDEISVIYDGNIYTYRTNQSGDRVAFVSENGIEDYDASKGIVAYYPPVSIDEEISVPAELMIFFNGSDQINAAQAPLVGVVESNSLLSGTLMMTFHNICSVLELRMDSWTLSNGIKSLTVEPASEGNFEGYLSFSGTVDPQTLAITTSTSGTSIKLNFPEGTSLGHSITLKFPVGRFKSPSGLRLTAEGVNGNTISRVVYATGVESYTENNGVFTVKHLAKPLYPFVLTQPEVVDMGLSVLWASCNLGAELPEDYGKYYAWGEIDTKNNYTWNTYKWGASAPFTKYSSEDAILDLEDDAAHFLLGSGWRMPTNEEFSELLNPDNCIVTNTTLNNVNGYSIESKLTGNSLFFPAAGRINGTTEHRFGLDGYYWTSTFSSSSPIDASDMKFWDDPFTSPFMGINYRYYGHSIRPVMSSVLATSPEFAEYTHLGGSGSFTFTIQDPRQGAEITAQSQDSWIKDVSLSGSTVNYTVAENNTGAKRIGRIKITDGYSSKDFYVTQLGVPVVSLTLNKSTLELAPGDSEMLVATVDPSDAPLQWSSDNTNVASVDQNGNVLANGNGVATIMVKAENGVNAICKVTVVKAIDLGLTVQWAQCNLGAASPEEYGDYYAWGETAPKSEFFWSNYEFRMSGDTESNVIFSKYNTVSSHGIVDNKIVLERGEGVEETMDDVARKTFGGDWRIPTWDEYRELENNCTGEWTRLNGVYGRRLTSNRNGNSIFLPAAGNWGDTKGLQNVGSVGFYWTSSLNEENPCNSYRLRFSSSGLFTSGDCTLRYFGLSIRPVRE